MSYNYILNLVMLTVKCHWHLILGIICSSFDFFFISKGRKSKAWLLWQFPRVLYKYFFKRRRDSTTYITCGMEVFSEQSSGQVSTTRSPSVNCHLLVLSSPSVKRELLQPISESLCKAYTVYRLSCHEMTYKWNTEVGKDWWIPFVHPVVNVFVRENILRQRLLQTCWVD